VYRLSNKAWHQMAGHINAALKARIWREQAGLTALDRYLAEHQADCNRRTWSRAVYTAYLDYLLRSRWESNAETEQRLSLSPSSQPPPPWSWWQRCWAEVSKPRHRKLRFWCYQQQQRAYATVAAQLCGGAERIAHCVVLWGDGSFGPTSRRYAAAPNKALQRGLAANKVELYLCNERGTSSFTACCQTESEHAFQKQILKNNPPRPALRFTAVRELRGLFYCKSPQPHRRPDMTLHVSSFLS
jgi:hypothetical protein